MRPLAIVLALVVAIGAVAIGAVAIVLNSPPSIDAIAASSPIARTNLTRPVSPDVNEGPIPTGDIDPGALTPRFPAGGECLDRIVRGDGWLDLCWQAARSGNEMDATKDFYILKVFGSHEKLRWMVVGSRLLTTPSGGSFAMWPDGTYEGACRQEPVRVFVPLPAPAMETVCGHTEATIDFHAWSSRVVWRCQSCLLPDATTRGFVFYNLVGVAPGSIPSWDVFAEASR